MADTQQHSPVTESHISKSEHYGARNYKPLPVVLARGKGEWVWDVDGRRYLDMLSAYSAVNQGHCHPRLQAAMVEQCNKITLTSRAFYNDQMSTWLEKLCKLAGKPKALPMNSGAEAVETGVKLARKWAYAVKKIPQDKAEIIVCANNFHGRTTTVVSFSTDDQYRKDFGPFTPGFKVIPFDDVDALKAAITPNTAAFLFEPIQGEAGVVVPKSGYLKKAAEICKAANVLLIADEIQTGLGRTGKMFCVEHEGIVPNMYLLGKALGGGFYPISAVVGDEEILGLLKPGDHGSTFGGNPLGCAVSIAALDVLIDEKLAERSEALGRVFRDELTKKCAKDVVKEIRGKGLLNAIELQNGMPDARLYSLELLRKGILAKDTHGTTVRFAPPLTMSEESLNWAIGEIADVFSKRIK